MTCESSEGLSLSWIAGNSECHIFRYKDSDGNPINLTGCTGLMEVQKSVWNDELIIPAKAAEIEPLEGLVKFKFTDTETSQLLGESRKLRFVFDTKLTFANGDVKTLTSGEIFITGRVTD